MEINSNAKILLDADVIIHFIKGGQTGIINQIFDNDLFLIDIVFKEVFKGVLRTNVENMIRFGIIKELNFDNVSIDIKKEYFKLMKDRGKGESAVMAYCRFHKDVIASCNISDIKKYCQKYNITYITTMDFISEAFRKRILTEDECDEFIRAVKMKGSKLIKGIDRIRDYIRE